MLLQTREGESESKQAAWGSQIECAVSAAEAVGFKLPRPLPPALGSPVSEYSDIGKAPARGSRPGLSCASAEDRSLMPMLWLNNRMQTLQAQTSGSDLLSQH